MAKSYPVEKSSFLLSSIIKALFPNLFPLDNPTGLVLNPKVKILFLPELMKDNLSLGKDTLCCCTGFFLKLIYSVYNFLFFSWIIYSIGFKFPTICNL